MAFMVVVVSRETMEKTVEVLKDLHDDHDSEHGCCDRTRPATCEVGRLIRKLESILEKPTEE